MHRPIGHYRSVGAAITDPNPSTNPNFNLTNLILDTDFLQLCINNAAFVFGK